MQGINAGVGNTAAGAIVQIVAKGAMNKYLDEKPTHTHWRAKYEKTSSFAMESVIQPFNSQVQFGQTSQFTLNRTGDLVYFMYVLIDLPGIYPVMEQQKGDDVAANMRSHFPCGTDTVVMRADAEVYSSYCSGVDVASVAGSANLGQEDVSKILRQGKARWLQEKYSCVDQMAQASESAGDEGGDDEELPPVWACWSNAIGQLLVKCASIVIGGSTIDSITNDFCYAWSELTQKKDISQMIGKYESMQELISQSSKRRVLYVPLQFWFTQHSGQALSLASLQFHGVQVHVEFERLERCITVSDPWVRVNNCQTNTAIAPSDLSAAIETTYVYLDTEERNKFATTHFEQLIVQVQEYRVTQQNSQIRMPLNFNHPVIEFIFMVRRQVHEKANQWFNYSGIDNRDIVCNSSLTLNGQYRWSAKPGPYLRLVQPYQYHTNVPDSFIYVYSFALHPEEPSPSGSVNCSRIDHVDLILNLQEGAGPVTVMVFARSWNILRYREGLAGLAFCN